MEQWLLIWFCAWITSLLFVLVYPLWEEWKRRKEHVSSEKDIA